MNMFLFSIIFGLILLLAVKILNMIFADEVSEPPLVDINAEEEARAKQLKGADVRNERKGSGKNVVILNMKSCSLFPCKFFGQVKKCSECLKSYCGDHNLPDDHHCHKNLKYISKSI